jgi:IS605 OrfB family transposase
MVFMAKEQEVATTRRAYTLRLSGIDRKDHSWREVLWKTHEAVNRGAKVFGDWLLTLRGGLDHQLAEAELKEGEKPKAEEIKHRRILLALSWLSVESKVGSPEKYRIESKQILDEFRRILEKREFTTSLIESWINDCKDSLQAEIRDDAVWINRSEAFDELSIQYQQSLNRSDAANIIEFFFEGLDSYFLSTDEVDGFDQEGKSYAIKAGNWLSKNWGTGEKSDNAHIVTLLEKIAQEDFSYLLRKPAIELLKRICQLFEIQSADPNYFAKIKEEIGWKGRPGSVEMMLGTFSLNTDDLLKQEQLDAFKTKLQKEIRTQRKKCGEIIPSWMGTCRSRLEGELGIKYVTGKNLTFEFAVMLDHALRHVSQAHSWIKLAEAEREQFDADAMKIERVPQTIMNWLDTFCLNRADETNAMDEYVIRPRSIQGWEEIVKVWSKPECQAEEDRIKAVRQVQSELDEDKKFGEGKLFESLAVDSAVCIWKFNGKPDTSILNHYVDARWARLKKRNYKVPAYRHPDEYKHPVFCDFGDSRWGIKFDIQKRVQSQKLQMKLWTGNGLEEKEYLWHSKRLFHDLGVNYLSQKPEAIVSRADRFGRSVAGVDLSSPVQIAAVFNKKKWNGRLQLSRHQLDELAYIRDHQTYTTQEKMKRIANLKENLDWFITFSADLQPIGPWYDYREQYSVFLSALIEENKKRKTSNVKLGLCRLPNIRILSVDLGHRYAAACVVWNTLSSDGFVKECNDAERVGKIVKINTLYATIESFELRKKKITRKAEREGKTNFTQTTYYRRIGPDILPNGQPNPAPWARLERQFLIKLQGEDHVRMAGLDEKEEVESFYREIGISGTSIPRNVPINTFLQNAIHEARLGLQRHAKEAHIAHYWTAKEKVGIGGISESLEGNVRIELLAEILGDWRNLFASTRAKDIWAESQWNELIEPKISVCLDMYDKKNGDSYQRRKEKEKELKTVLIPLAKQLTELELEQFHKRWFDHWQTMDEVWRNNLKRLRNLVLPHKIKDYTHIRYVGGLSLERIDMIRSLYQVEKAFYARFQPDGTRQIPKEKFGQRILDTMEKLRENRLKQLASRIIEAALGCSHVDAKGKRHSERKYNPCHVVVIEDLSNYRAEQTRKRAENRRTMDWKSATARKYLEDACQIYGLHLRSVNPRYTSQQDSRTGAPGLRCKDLPVFDFLNETHWIRPRIESAKEKIAKGKANNREIYLVDCFNRLMELTEHEREKVGVLRLPIGGSEIFVSASTGKELQADLNAAANIGLRALLDPDWEGRWWYLHAEPKTFKPKSEKLTGCTIIDVKQPLRVESSMQNHQNKETIYLWRDICTEPIHQTPWKTTFDYWHEVEKNVCKVLQKQLEKRINHIQETPF